MQRNHDHSHGENRHGHSHVCHDHPMHIHGATSGGKMWLSLILTLIFTAGEAAAGMLSHSLALISDAGHNLSDGLALGLAAFALWIAKKPATSKHTFGYHRVGILTALFNAATLMGISAWIGIEAIGRFLHPVAVDGSIMMIVAAIAFVLNTGIALLLRHDAKNSLNSKAAFIHMAGDAVAIVI